MIKKKKILWFVNADVTEMDLETQSKTDGKGWLITLANFVSDEFELHIASVDPYKNPKKGIRITNHYLRPQFWKLKLFLSSLVSVPDKDGDLLPQMIEIVQNVKPDMIHIHGTEKQYIRIVEFAEQNQIPLLVSLQGIMSAISGKFSTAYGDSFIKKFVINFGGRPKSIFPKTLNAKYRHLKKQGYLEEKILPQVKNFDGRTAWDYQISGLFNPKRKYFHIDRILKPAFYKAVWTEPQPNEMFHIHTTMGNSTFKGLDTVIEACYFLDKLDIKYNWTVAGVDKDDWSVRAARKKLGKRFASNNVVFLGRQSAQDLTNCLLKSHLYVMASNIENSPNNLAEAMLVGVPCIATLAGGTISYLTHDYDGYLVQPGEPLGLAAAIFELLNDRRRAGGFARNARETALKRHNQESIKDQLKKAYLDLIV
jgi:glycosyltransferase involved in cell wall biosynthesis